MAIIDSSIKSFKLHFNAIVANMWNMIEVCWEGGVNKLVLQKC